MRRISFVLLSFATLSLLCNCGGNRSKDKDVYYTVSFDTNNGTPNVESQTVKEGEYASDPKIAVARGEEVLKCWSLQDEGDINPTAFVFETTKITSDTILHAIFESKPQPQPEPEPVSETEMNFKCLSDTASLIVVENDSNFSLEYSVDSDNWKNVNFDEVQSKYKFHTFSLKKDEVVYFRGDNNEGFNEKLAFTTKEKDGELSISGSIMSLIQKTNFSSITNIPEKCFVNIFEANENLKDASGLILPETLSKECFRGMFESCKSLVNAPELPATTLLDSCYDNMFYECTSLSVAPKLPATKLATYCYCDMFCKCSSLTIPPNLLDVTELADGCYWLMFQESGLKINTKGEGTEFFISPSDTEKYSKGMFESNNNPLPDTAYFYSDIK